MLQQHILAGHAQIGGAVLHVGGHVGGADDDQLHVGWLVSRISLRLVSGSSTGSMPAYASSGSVSSKMRPLDKRDGERLGHAPGSRLAADITGCVGPLRRRIGAQRQRVNLLLHERAERGIDHLVLRHHGLAFERRAHHGGLEMIAVALHRHLRRGHTVFDDFFQFVCLHFLHQHWDKWMRIIL